MAHLPLPRWPKSNSTAAGVRGGATTITSTIESATSANNCCGLTKLMKRLKKRSKLMLNPSISSKQSSTATLQCRGYDPLSYSLNFDTGGDLLDEDYYKFYAFSSRFVNNASSRINDCQRVLVTASN
ncbi:hypothetical protein ACJIZ3_008543 [Penstemon smallii]|uniref:Uncharacterized protein n=1 Tax=Penstemon smallii TaxID=265156 RepID=A0ABD3TA16_9LAMI